MINKQVAGPAAALEGVRDGSTVLLGGFGTVGQRDEQDHPLRKIDNAVITPHLGYVTQDTFRIFYRQTVEDIRAFLDGKPVRVIGSK